ncbi:MAG: hypothetical protein EA384_06390 [Spirochaetaceae bacterium]|nr:MAG: hypothetical protein EA384_06390 [Spirochaetaceae bacterium]
MNDLRHPIHITLLGDSIFDNAAYTRGEPAVVDHLQSLLGPSGTATLRAVDNAVTRQVVYQLEDLPVRTTHLVISSGGNDTLQHIDLLLRSAPTVSDALDQLREPLALFERDYRAPLGQVPRLGISTWCFTIYNGILEAPHPRTTPMR